MPGGICGTWPAWWLYGDPGDSDPDTDPTVNTGEIDIIEGANSQSINTVTLWDYRTVGTCHVQNDPSAYESLTSTDCHGSTDGTGGCETNDGRNNSFGIQFNQGHGGVYALEWTANFIRVFFLPRDSIPSCNDGPLGSSPDPSKWDRPTAYLRGCDFDAYFHGLHMIFDTTFCGDMAGGPAWKKDAVCSQKAVSCEGMSFSLGSYYPRNINAHYMLEYVRNNTEVFKESYWLINSVKVYQQNTADGCL